MNGKLKSKPDDRLRAYHTAHATRCLEKHCNEAGRTSMEQHTIEKKNKKAKHEEEVTMKTDQCQEEDACADSRRKKVGGMQQKCPRN